MSGEPNKDFSEAVSNVPHADLLKRFTSEVLGDDELELDTIRKEFVAELGNEALVDTCAVIAQFEIVNRIADATGIPLDDGLEGAVSAGLAMPGLKKKEI